MAARRAELNRNMRKEALRESLANGEHLRHVVSMAEKIADLGQPLDSDQLQRLKVAIDTKLRLINKYLPDVKSIELTGEDGGPVYTLTKVELVRSANPDA